MQGVVTNQSGVCIHILSHRRRGEHKIHSCVQIINVRYFAKVQTSIKRDLGQVLSVLSRSRNLPRQGQYGNNGYKYIIRFLLDIEKYCIIIDRYA